MHARAGRARPRARVERVDRGEIRLLLERTGRDLDRVNERTTLAVPGDGLAHGGLDLEPDLDVLAVGYEPARDAGRDVDRIAGLERDDGRLAVAEVDRAASRHLDQH